MAENESGQERTEEPTAKRLREAREKGQIARSRELSTMLVLLVSGFCMMIFGPGMLDRMLALVRENFRLERAEVFDQTVMFEHLMQSIFAAISGMAPFAIAATLAALIGPTALGGMAFSSKVLAPKLSKLNPIKGLGRLFSPKALLEFGKTLAKFIVVTAVATMVLWLQAERIIALNYTSLAGGMAALAQMLLWSFLAFSFSLILIAAIDVPFQLWDHRRQLKMTRQEIKEEMKDTEGRPEVKGRIRQLQREMAQGRMMAEVPEADVVITNPTHYAVALRYQSDQGAPRLVAKGVDEVARHIRELAAEHGVPTIEVPPLARGLYHSTDLDALIPAELYVAVAQVLAYIFQLKQGVSGLQSPDVSVPQEFLQKHGADLASQSSQQSDDSTGSTHGGTE